MIQMSKKNFNKKYGKRNLGWDRFVVLNEDLSIKNLASLYEVDVRTISRWRTILESGKWKD